MHARRLIIRHQSGSIELPSCASESLRSDLPGWVYAPSASTTKSPAQPPAGNTALLTLREAAVELRLSTKTIQRHIRSGLLPAIRIGRTVRIARSALDALAAPQKPQNCLQSETCRE